jgi:hypothetical protein
MAGSTFGFVDPHRLLVPNDSLENWMPGYRDRLRSARASIEADHRIPTLKVLRGRLDDALALADRADPAILPNVIDRGVLERDRAMLRKTAASILERMDRRNVRQILRADMLLAANAAACVAARAGDGSEIAADLRAAARAPLLVGPRPRPAPKVEVYPIRFDYYNESKRGLGSFYWDMAESKKRNPERMPWWLDGARTPYQIRLRLRARADSEEYARFFAVKDETRSHVAWFSDIRSDWMPPAYRELGCGVIAKEHDGRGIMTGAFPQVLSLLSTDCLGRLGLVEVENKPSQAMLDRLDVAGVIDAKLTGSFAGFDRRDLRPETLGDVSGRLAHQPQYFAYLITPPGAPGLTE